MAASRMRDVECAPGELKSAPVRQRPSGLARGVRRHGPVMADDREGVSDE